MKKSIFNYLFKLILIILSFGNTKSYSQNTEVNDSMINKLMNESITTSPADAGVTLMKNSNFSAATNFYSAEISKNEGNAAAYFNRGISQWQTNEPAKACQDWSAVLALGDTATFKLLDAKCHGAMVIDGDTIKKVQYRQMFATSKPSAQTSSSNLNAMTVVEQMPEFIGGNSALMNYIGKSIRYPNLAREKNIQGTVIVNIIISSKGNVMFPYVKKGIGGGCDEEALRIIRDMPTWKPGKQNGKPVLVRYNIPIKFALGK